MRNTINQSTFDQEVVQIFDEKNSPIDRCISPSSADRGLAPASLTGASCWDGSAAAVRWSVAVRPTRSWSLG